MYFTVVNGLLVLYDSTGGILCEVGPTPVARARPQIYAASLLHANYVPTLRYTCNDYNLNSVSIAIPSKILNY